MNPDEIDPRPKPAKPKDLATMSIEALQDYIAELEAEIARTRETIAAKETARSAADSVFRR